jgi:hypothetical protein
LLERPSDLVCDQVEIQATNTLVTLATNMLVARATNVGVCDQMAIQAMNMLVSRVTNMLVARATNVEVFFKKNYAIQTGIEQSNKCVRRG